MLLIAVNFLDKAFAAISRRVANFGKIIDWITRDSEKSDVLLGLEPRRLTLAEQWTRLGDIVKGAMLSADEAAHCHASAAMQLDLAQYALTSLVDELSAVMDVGGRRKRANVYVLEILSPRPVGSAIAA